MLVRSFEVGNCCLRITEVTESPQVPSSHSYCSNSSCECLWENKPGWLDVPCYVATNCWCAIPLNPQEAVHTLSFTDVCITTEGRGQMAWGARATQLWLFSEARLQRCRVGVMKWEKARKEGKKERFLCDKLWLKLCSSSSRLDETNDGPHAEPFALPNYPFWLWFYALSELSYPWNDKRDAPLFLQCCSFYCFYVLCV